MSKTVLCLNLETCIALVNINLVKKKKNPSQGLIEKKKLAAMFGIDLNGTGLRFPATGRTNSEMPFLRV